jgi:hypothetical protein
LLDLRELDPAELIPLRKTYALVNVLSERDHMANFIWTLQLAEGARGFHEVTDRIASAGINPVTFIAVHALGQCAVQLKNYPPNEHFSSLTDFLFDTTRTLLGDEIHGHLREWTDASHAEGESLAAKGPWAKLGAMTRSLSTLDSYTGFDADFVREHGDLLKEAIAVHRAIADACKGLSPELDEYYESRLQEVESLLKPQPPAAPLPGAPGPR